jgi:hypothetical protein
LGEVEEGYARAFNLVTRAGQLYALPSADKGKPANQDQPLPNDTVRHTRRQNTHTAGGAGLEPAARKHVVPTFTARPSPPPDLIN